MISKYSILLSEESVGYILLNFDRLNIEFIPLLNMDYHKAKIKKTLNREKRPPQLLFHGGPKPHLSYSCICSPSFHSQFYFLT